MSIFDGVFEFVRVSQTRNFSEAARQLGVTPSAVSKAVSRLEASLGVRLLNRTSRSVTMTSEGEEFLATADAVVSAMVQARDGLRDKRGVVEGVFRLSLPSAFGVLFLGDVVRELNEAHPGLKIETTVTDRFVDFAEERMDLAIRLGEPPDSRLIAKRMVSVDFMTVASPDYLESRGIPSTVEDLQNHALVGFRFLSSGQVRSWTFNENGDPKTVAPDKGALVNDPLTYRNLLESGVGIGQGPDYLLRDSIKSGKLVEILTDQTSGDLPLSFLYPKPLGQSKRLRAVMAAFEKRLIL